MRYPPPARWRHFEGEDPKSTKPSFLTSKNKEFPGPFILEFPSGARFADLPLDMMQIVNYSFSLIYLHLPMTAFEYRIEVRNAKELDISV